MTTIAPPRPTVMGAWVDRAACRGVDTELFYPSTSTSKRIPEDSVAPAAQVCAVCPVRAECLADAQARPDRYGIRAGTTPAERRRGLAHVCTECGVASPKPVCRCCTPTQKRKEKTVTSSGVTIRFVEELPEPGQPREGRHQATARILRKSPDLWAEVATGLTKRRADRLASNIRCGTHYAAYTPQGAFQAEIRTATRAQDGYAVYARYVGTK